MIEPIFKEEEKLIISSVDKAKASSNNSQVIGRNGEKPLIDFLNNYLPPTLKAVSGHFITPNQYRSPQIDIMIIDSRYPLLGYNSDGTVLVMSHSILRIIEIKTNLTSKDISKTSRIFLDSRSEIDNIWDGEPYTFKKPIFEVLAYRISVKVETIEKTYFNNCNPLNNHFQLTILRCEKTNENGCAIYFHSTSHWPDFTEKDQYEHKDYMIDEYMFGSHFLKTPLSDFYYSLIQDSYYCLAARDYSFDDIGEHFNLYLNWSTTR